MNESERTPKESKASKKITSALDLLKNIRDRQVTEVFNPAHHRASWTLRKGSSPLEATDRIFVTFGGDTSYARCNFKKNPNLVYRFDVEKDLFDLRLCFRYERQINNEFDDFRVEGKPACQFHFQNFRDLYLFMHYIGVGFTDTGEQIIRKTYKSEYLKTDFSGKEIMYLYHKRPDYLRVIGEQSGLYFRDFFLSEVEKTDAQKMKEVQTLLHYDLKGGRLPFDGWWKDSENVIPMVLSTVKDTNAVLNDWLKNPGDLISYYEAIEDIPGGLESFVGLITSFCLKAVTGMEGWYEDMDTQVDLPKKYDIMMRYGSAPVVQENDDKEKGSEKKFPNLFKKKDEIKTYPIEYQYEFDTGPGFPLETVVVDNTETEWKTFDTKIQNAHGYGDPKIITTTVKGSTKVVATTKTEVKTIQEADYTSAPFEIHTTEREVEVGVHPLTLIKFQNYEDDVNNIAIVPAIYVKLLADRKRIADRNKLINDIFIVVQIVLTIYGVGAALNATSRLARAGWLLFEAANAADFAIEIINPYPEDEAVSTYVDNYHTFVLGLNIAVGIVALPQLIRYGMRVISKFGSSKLSKEVIELCENFVEEGIKKLELPGIKPNSVSRIKTDVAKVTKLNPNFVKRLNHEGVVFATATKADGSVTYVVIYDGEAIFEGTAKQLRKDLKHLQNKTGADLGDGLRQHLRRFGKRPVKMIEGPHSQRDFDINNCGGPILDLSWKEAKFSKEGLDTIKKHLGRLEQDEWNVRMIERIDDILSGKIKPTDFDRRFYTHEIREFERYKALGFEHDNFLDIPEQVWENAHAATLEDYGLHEIMIYEGEKIRSLYHPDIQKI